MSRHTVVFALLLAAGVEIAALRLGADASWDTRNYHLYDPFALLNKADGVDIAPAHMQTWFSPTMDLYYYALARTAASTPVLNALAALPHALALVLMFALTCRLLRAQGMLDQAIAAVAVLVGATGAAGFATLATAMDEMLPASLFLGGLLVLLTRERTPSGREIVVAGLLAGSACGLKLTFSYAAIALAITVLTIPGWRGWRSVPTRLVLLGLGGAIGAAAFSGYWWVLQWQRFGNPLFPIMNDVFRSPWSAPASWVDPNFLPQSWGQALQAPWAWALSLYRGASESHLRDPRFALGVIAAVLCLAQSLAPASARPSWQVRFVAIWFLLAFALWRLEFSIYRYLALLELFTGPLIALCVMPLARRVGALRSALVGIALLLVPLDVLTVYPFVARAPRGAAPLQVAMPQVPPGGMILLLDATPLAYLALFQDKQVRFVATHDYFMSLDPANSPMQTRVAAAIAGQTGEIWGLETPSISGATADEPLAAYGLVRGECRIIESSLSSDPVRMCRLRKAAPAERQADDLARTAPPRRE